MIIALGELNMEHFEYRTNFYKEIDILEQKILHTYVTNKLLQKQALPAGNAF